MVKPVALDLEVYRDYFLCMLGDRNKKMWFEMYEDHPLDVVRLRGLLRQLQLLTFNGNRYDMPLLGAALEGATCAQLKAFSDQIIQDNQPPWRLGLNPPRGLDHIDLIDVAPGLTGLKTYAGRMGAKRMQDLPIHHDALIAPEERPVIVSYCGNDILNTLDLYDRLKPQLALREKLGEQYGQDLRSKSDAQISEAVIKTEVARITGEQVGKPDGQTGRTFRYKPPAFITPGNAYNFVAGCEFVVQQNGQPKCTELDNHRVMIGDTQYRMGVGGLHSCEASVAHVPGEDEFLIDRDVASFYPSIILLCHLYPETMGVAFGTVYRTIYDRRLLAKHTGDKVTADTLKISLNGTFGKLGSRFSCLYAPELLIQVTVTGQLVLLQLIEMIEAAGAHVVSANTDGIVVRGKKNRYNAVCSAIEMWERATGFETEETGYTALFARDVNSYIAIKPDGEVKLKGAYAETSLKKSPANEVCNFAVIEFLTKGTPIERTIRACTDPRNFCTVRKVNGGAMWRGEEIGRIIRWYRSTEGEAITYRINGNKVPLSDMGRPMMLVPDEMPEDIDYGWYVRQATDMLVDLGVQKLF